MANIVDSATEIYVFVDDYLKSHPHLAHWRRSNHWQPGFTDAEVLSIALMQGVFGVDSLKQTYRLVGQNLGSCFPRLPSYQQWLARLHRVEFLTSHLLAALGQWGLAPTAERLFVIDSKPLPLCKPIRHGRVRLLRDDGAYFAKNSCGWYFGFTLHAVSHQPTGLLVNVMVTPANTDDRFGLTLCEQCPDGILLSDDGYSGAAVFDALVDDYALTRVMPRDARDSRILLSQLRQRIETTFSQCWRGFIDRIFSRSWRGLWNTVKLKLIYYNLLCLKFLAPLLTQD